MESSPRVILGQSNETREAGNFTQALKLTDQATLAFQKEDDQLGLAETQASRAIVFKLLYRQTNDRSFLTLAKTSSQAGVEIAKEGGNKEALAIPLFELAKIEDELGNFPEAVSVYKEAVSNMESNPPALHNRPSILADMKNHLATAEYKAGDKTALSRALEALADLEKNPDISKYNQDVWVSGAFMRLAEMLKNDNPGDAKMYLQKAKVVIDANPDLKLRQEQWEKLAQTFK